MDGPVPEHGVRLRRELRMIGVDDAEIRRARRRGELVRVRRGSHVSAAVVHGIAIWDLPLDRVHVTRDRHDGGRRTRDLHVHPSPVPPEHRRTVRGIAVTSPARTVVDVAGTSGFERGLVVAEFDGRIKYGRALRPGQDLAEVLWEEKLREDRIRAAGFAMIRWIWSDITRFAPTAARLHTALTR